eukprot:scaffold60157_cov79-Phaeocystis_antarctica.AAC.3
MNVPLEQNKSLTRAACTQAHESVCASENDPPMRVAARHESAALRAPSLDPRVLANDRIDACQARPRVPTVRKYPQLHE